MSVLLRAVLIAGLSACAAVAQAADAPDRRAVRKAPVVVTTVSAEETAALRENIIDLLRQIEDMQLQIQQLQNQVELQTHEVSQLKARERDLMGDLDRRLRELERSAAERAAAPSPPPAATAPTAPTRTVSTVEQQEYDAAFTLMKQGRYQRAIKGFRTFMTKYADSPLADNAQYWIAEGNYVLRNYKVARDEFSKVMSGYPNSPKAPDALLKIGFIQQELDNGEQARRTLQDLVQRFPQSNAAKLAQQRLDKMKGAKAAR